MSRMRLVSFSLPFFLSMVAIITVSARLFPLLPRRSTPMSSTWINWLS